MNHMRNPRMFNAAFGLIRGCLHNKEFDDAILFARTAYEMVFYDTDGIIPADQRQELLARGSHWLARAIRSLAEEGRIPPGRKQLAGEEAIALARKALDIDTQLQGIESNRVAEDMDALANALRYFHDDVDDDEILRLYEQSITIFSRGQGSSSVNVAVVELNLGNAYICRAERAEAANDLNGSIANLKLAIQHIKKSTRIYRAINHVNKECDALQSVVQAEKYTRQIKIAAAAAAT